MKNPASYLPNPLLILSPLRTGIVVGVGAIGVGIAVLYSSSSGDALFSGVCFLVGGSIFLGYTVFVFFWSRREHA